MKKYFPFILIFIIHINELKSQSFCTATSKPPSANVLSVNCPLVSNPSIYNIRINVHYMLRNDGTGNFTETNDPFNSNVGYNGYRFAAEILNFANGRLSNNALMQYQPTPSVPALPINHRYILNGVYFWRSTDAYDNHAEDLSYLRSNFGKDIGYAINVFMVKNITGTAAQGAANLDYDVCFVRGQDVVFSRYLTSNDASSSFSVFYDVINHEILHNLSLSHTIKTPATNQCCNNVVPECDDECLDTPTASQIVASGKPNICKWCWDAPNNDWLFSNNIMDYSCSMAALTPCQINRVNTNIVNNKTCFLSCAFDTQNIDVCISPTESKSYIARNINVIPTSCTSNSILLPVNYRIVFNAETTIINKNFEVPLGTEFEIIPAVSCTN